MKSPLTYERIAQGEIHPPLTASDRQKLATLKEEDRVFLEKFPPASLNLRPKTSIFRHPVWLSLGSTAAVLAVLLFGIPSAGPDGSDTRPKGAGLSLLVYHRTPTGSEPLRPETVLGKNDEIQLAYALSQKRYAAIYSVDGRGSVTVHFPLNAAQAELVEPQQPQLLPYSYKLDDAPEFEALFLIASDKPFAVADLKVFLQTYVAEKEPQLLLPSGFTSTTFRIAKKEPRS